LTIFFHFHIDFMIDLAETHVEFILAVLSPATTTISDRENRHKGRHGLYSPIRKRTSGGDTSPVLFPIDGFNDPFGRGIVPIR
jgi:hypothetical protein